MGGRIAVVTIPSDLGLKPFITDLASVATVFVQRVLFYGFFGFKIQATVETVIMAMIVQRVLFIQASSICSHPDEDN